MSSALPFQSRASSRGFMMVEALVTVLIISVGLIVIIQSLAQTFRATVFSADYTMAVLVADNALSRAMIERYGVESKPAEAQATDLADDKYRATLSIENVEKSDDLLQALKVDVLWRSGQNERSLGAVSYLLSRKGL